MGFIRKPSEQIRRGELRPKKQNKQIPISQVDVHRANKLFKVLAKRKLAKQYDEVLWPRELARLTIDGSGWKARSAEEIDRVLEWYCQNCNKQGIPKIWSAKAFWDRYEWLLEKMMEDIGPPVKLQADQYQPILDKLLKLDWPQTSLEQLPSVIQLSLDAYTPFYNQAIKLCKQMVSKFKRNEEGRLFLPFKKRKGDLEEMDWAQYADRLGGNPVGSPRQDLPGLLEPDMFVEYWFMDIHELRSKWDDWDGNLLRDVWTSDNKLYKKQMRKWTGEIKEEYMWDEFVAQLGEQ